MKKITLCIMCAFLVLFNIGCQGTKTRAVEGAVIGSILGAGAGYGIGQGSHHGAQGAGIGAAAGAITGAIVGSQIEKPAAGGQTQESAATYNQNQMSLQQIVDMSKQGIHEDVIIDKIRLSNSKFTLSADDISYLQQQGVSQRVIGVMQGK